MKKIGKSGGFTLLELVVVVIIIGILASLAIPQYTIVMEKGRSAEARRILGFIREAMQAYYLQRDTLATNIGDLAVTGFPLSPSGNACSDTNFYFKYNITGAGGATDSSGLAMRCTSGGKSPNSATAYNLTLTYVGVWGSTNSAYL